MSCAVFDGLPLTPDPRIKVLDLLVFSTDVSRVKARLVKKGMLCRHARQGMNFTDCKRG
jgi:hypothetical protein